MVKDSIYLILVVFLCDLFHLLQSRRAVTWSLQRFIFHPRLSWQRFVVSWTSWPSFYRKSTQPWKKFGAQSQPEWWQWLITAGWGAHGYQGGTLGQRNHAYPQCTPKNTPWSLGSFWGQNKRGDYWFEIIWKNGILLPKLFWPTVRKNCSSDQEKNLKFEAEGREFAKFLRSLEQFIQTVKGQNNFW